MKPLLTILFLLNLANNLHGNARYPDPILYKEKGILVEIPETEYLIKECGDGWFQFRSQRREQAKTVRFRQLKKYPVITFPHLCAFLYALPDSQKEFVALKRSLNIPTPIEAIVPPSPIEIYLLRLKAIYLIEKDSKKRKATITQIYYYAVNE